MPLQVHSYLLNVYFKCFNRLIFYLLNAYFNSLKYFEAVRMRETFQQIYQAKTRTDFEQLLSKWYNWVSQCNLPAMLETSKTIKTHWQGSVQWKLSSINNGILEGLNSIIQVTKRKARGYGKKTFVRLWLIC